MERSPYHLVPRQRRGGTFAAGLVLLLVAGACAPGDAPQAGGSEGEPVRAFVGARLIDGTGAPPVEDGVLLVRGKRVAAAGPAGSVAIPEGAEVVDLSGRVVMPGIINAHGHVGTIGGLPGAERYTRELLLDQLGRYARYGVTTVVSLGGDGPEGVALRKEQEAVPMGPARARLYVAGPVLDPSSPEEVPELVDGLVEMGVDWVKFRVDDFLGSREAMSPEVYTALIHEGQRRGLPVAAHMVRLEDAVGLLEAGVDLLAHSVRDLPVDEDFIRRMREAGICLSPTVTREISTFVYGERPDFFDDPFFQEHSDLEMAELLEDPERQASMRANPGGQYWRSQLPLAEANMKALSDAGIPLAFGTDTGPFGRFQGFFEHLEMERMARAGISPEKVLLSATRDAAACMGLEELGTLEPGRLADFLVLRADPLEDIRNSREIQEVWIGGMKVPDSGVPGDR